MKRTLCIILILLTLSGCAQKQEGPGFYYLRSEILYGTEDAVIALEYRDPSITSQELSYLISLYLEGPLDSVLSSPFPAGTTLIQLEQVGTTLSLTLSRNFCTLEGIDRTLACSCIALTCFSLTDAQAVRIQSGDPSINGIDITLSRGSLTLFDTAAAATTQPEE